MKAMILAAGEGTRIRDVTEGDIPKPMVDLGEGPLLEHTVNTLVDFGVDEIIINLHHRGGTIRDYFGEEWQGTPIHYSEEEELLGTSGGVKKVGERFDDTFIVIYGDVLMDLDLDKLVDYHYSKNGVGTILVYREKEENLPEASIILTDSDNRVAEFLEKPSLDTIESYSGEDFWTNAGVYVLEPSIIDFMPEGFSDFSHDIFPEVLESTSDLYIYPRPENSYWHEVGNPKRYKTAVEDVKTGKVDFKTG